MKYLITFSLLLLGLVACKNKPANPNEQDLTAVANTIHQFAQWYHDFSNSAAGSPQFVDQSGTYLRLDSTRLEQYLGSIKASGLVSDQLLERERAYYKQCALFWMNQDKKDAPVGMDSDRFICGQDWDVKLWTSGPVSADGLGTDEVEATLSNLEGGRTVKFSLEKEVDKWLITNIDCGEKSRIETNDYEGHYYSEEKACPMEIIIARKNGGYTYQLKSARRNTTGTLGLDVSDGSVYLVFNGLKGSSNTTSMDALFLDNNITFQNYGNSMNQFINFKECDQKYITLVKGASAPAVTPEKAVKPVAEAPKPAAKTSKGGLPVVTVNAKGDITVSGKKMAIEEVRKVLQKQLLNYTVIPDQLLIKPIGEVGMGTRHELQTVVGEAVSGAKWVRKKGALEAVNQAVSERLNAATQLEMLNYQTNGYYALVDAKPLYANGNPVDYSISPFKYEYQSGSFADRVIAILKYEKGNWKILTYTIGANAVPVNTWVKKYGVPRSLFEK